MYYTLKGGFDGEINMIMIGFQLAMFDYQRVMRIYSKNGSGFPFLVELSFLDVSENGGFDLNTLWPLQYGQIMSTQDPIDGIAQTSPY